MNEQNAEKTKYCSHCGTEMTLTKKRTRPYFDSDTGQELQYFYHYWKCPKKKFFLDGHDKYDDVPSDF